MALILDVKNLATHFQLGERTLKAVNGIDFSLSEGETLAIVGESGCGKSVTAASIMRLVPPPGKNISGEIFFTGNDLMRLSDEEMRHLRGNRISMIFQDPMTALNPVLTVGFQIIEGLRIHQGVSLATAEEKALAILHEVGIPSPSERFSAYPHQLSGGMRQRVMIAMALSLRPQLLIADEPTTALDVTIQAQILELIDRLKRESNMGFILISHDLGIVAERSHKTAIMYAGRFVEYASTTEIFSRPLHPYTEGLLNSLPQNAVPGSPLPTIPGFVPDLMGELPGCAFCDRCPTKSWQCRKETPEMLAVSKEHFVRCWKYA